MRPRGEGGEHTGFRERLSERPRADTGHYQPREHGAHDVDCGFGGVHIRVVDEDFVAAHEQPRKRTGEYRHRQVPAPVCEHGKGDFGAHTLDEARQQNLTAESAPGQEHGNEGGHHLTVQCGTGFADQVPAEHPGEQPGTANEGLVFGDGRENGFSGRAHPNIPHPEHYGAGYRHDRYDHDFVHTPCEARFM